MIANPKKNIVVDYNSDDVKNAILKINKVDSNYKLEKNNEIMKMYTFSCLEFLSLGVYVDINYKYISDTSTEIFVEIRRKTGAFDKDYEVSKANKHIESILDAISSLLLDPNTTKNKKTFFGQLLGVIAWILGIIILLAIPSSSLPLLNVVIFLLLINKTVRNIYKKITNKK